MHPLIFDSLALSPEDLGKPCVAYQGATIDQSVNDTYSFVPCKPADKSKLRFERPLIEHPTYVEPNLRMGAKITQAPPDAARDMWTQVREQMLGHELALALHVDLPEEAHE